MNTPLTDSLTRAIQLASDLEHELFVAKSSERLNAEYARCFELERNKLQKAFDAQTVMWENALKERDALRAFAQAVEPDLSSEAYSQRTRSQKWLDIYNACVTARDVIYPTGRSAAGGGDVPSATEAKENVRMSDGL